VRSSRLARLSFSSESAKGATLAHNCYRNNAWKLIIYDGQSYSMAQFVQYQEVSGDVASTNVDPQFVTRLPQKAADVRLGPRSSLIDAGVRIEGMERDFAGAPVPQGTGVDVGAFEFSRGARHESSD